MQAEKGTELERTETVAKRGRFRVDRGGNRPVRETQIADRQFDGCAGAGCCSGREVTTGESLLCHLVQQDGVALQLRQQLPFGQTTNGYNTDDHRAMGIDVFSFKRHTACSLGDAPIEQNEAARRLTVSRMAMMDDGSTTWLSCEQYETSLREIVIIALQLEPILGSLGKWIK